MAVRPMIFRYALILIVGVVAFLLLSLSWPRLRASLRYLPVDTAMSKYWENREANTGQLDALIERAREAIALHDHYRYWEGLSELQILSGQDMGKPYWQRRQVLEQSILSATEVVRRAPAQPRTWLRIARTRAFLGYTQDELIPAWKMSVLTGRVEPTLMLTRLELGFRYFNGLDDEAVLLLRDQAVLTWAVHRQQVLERLQSGSLDFDLMREVLSGQNQDIVADMEAHLGISPVAGPGGNGEGGNGEGGNGEGGNGAGGNGAAG